MSYEVIVFEVQPVVTFVSEPRDPPRNKGKKIQSFRENYFKDVYEINQPITGNPEFGAIRHITEPFVKYLFKIDPSRSNFRLGKIAPASQPNWVEIPLRGVKGLMREHSVWYTSFRTLLTHVSVDEFTVEKSKPFCSNVIEGENPLCNGYLCNHIRYCKFFNHSQTPITRMGPSRTTLKSQKNPKD